MNIEFDFDQRDFYKNFYDFSFIQEELTKSNKQYCIDCCSKNCNSCAITDAIKENEKTDWFDINFFYAQMDEYEAAKFYKKPESPFLTERDKNFEKEAYEKLNKILNLKKELNLELSYFEENFKNFLEEEQNEKL